MSLPWWIFVLAVIGACALIAASLTLFTNLGGHPESAEMTEDCGVDSREFLAALAGTINAPLLEGGVARLLNNGDEFVPALLHAIGRAKRTINVMFYIWEPGQFSNRLFDALTAKARQGVEVRVMVDALGALKAPRDRIEELTAAGGRWEWFHPIRPGYLLRVHKRNHRRAVVIDGKVGFTGGMSVMDKWLGYARNSHQWRDCMVEVRGCIATNLQSAFAQLWSHVTGEMLVGDAFYPPEHEAELAERGPGEPISKHINVVSSPSGGAHTMRQVFWITLRAACRQLYITNPYFVPDRVMRSVLKNRARAGVDVRVLVPGTKMDVRPIRWASHALYEELLEAGVRIYEYQPTMIHQKVVVVDGVWALIGSANMDVRSKELNLENLLGILDVGFARELEDTFFADLESSREILLEEFRRRPLLHRIPEQLAALFEKQA